jgi:8-oxo-dGTP pyrophosphatase MutT (NUDIX family)
VKALRQQVHRLQALLLERAYTTADASAVPLVLGGQACGSVDAELASRIAAAVPGFLLEGGVLRLAGDGNDGGSHLDAPRRSQSLEQAARWLLGAGRVSAWRDEPLDVLADGQATVLARIDRSAVRALGITTQSVRLNGFTADGRLFVARRAAHKRVDPAMWDNLAGGLMASGETLQSAIVRETWEEAGLDITGCTLAAGGHLRVRRRLPDGVLCEIVHVFDLDLAPGTVAANRDGEVERFEIWELSSVLDAIEHGAFTIEASLATLDALMRRA